MPHHPVSESECCEEKAQAAKSQSNVTKVTAIIASAVLVLGLLASIFGFIMKTDNKADGAHTRIDALKDDVREIKSDVKQLTKAVLKRLPDDE